MNPRPFVAVLIVAVLIVALVPACGGGESRTPPTRPGLAGQPPTRDMLEDAARDFAELRTGYLEWYFEAHPVRASELGVHDHDARLTGMRRADIQGRIDALLDWLADLERIPFDFMREDDRYDYAVLEYALRAELLELEESRGWVSNPRLYVALIARGIVSVADGRHASGDDRIDALAARLAQAPAVLDAARRNLRSPPRLWTEIAISDARTLIDYLEADLPATLAAALDGEDLPAAVERARTDLVAALEAYGGWLETELLPRSTGTHRLGRYLLERKLRYEEHISLALNELERINGEAIASLTERLRETARAIDPNRTAAAILDSLAAAHPSPDSLLPAARAAMDSARAWTLSSGVVMVPREEPPTVRPSPPYARDRFSSLDAPGAFEAAPLETFFNVTTVGDGWTPDLVAEYLSNFSGPELLAMALHDTYPGRHVQEMYARDLTELRRVFVPDSFAEGWARYAEAMALDEGFTSSDPVVRLVHLRRALQAHARWHAVLHIHAMDDPLDTVVRRVMEIAYMDEFPARREVIRATYEPMTLADALGRIQIAELRRDYEAHLEEEGDETFSLADFHQRLLRMGLPIPLVREVLLPVDSGPQRPTRRFGAPDFRNTGGP